jgi:transposase InsO family protein
MESRLLAVFTVGLSSVRVTELCAELGISRQTFYKYRRRFAAEGPPGLLERSRRPHSSPQQVGVEIENEIVRLRKELSEAGHDAGAFSIAGRMRRAGREGVPSDATIHRILLRRGQVSPQPEKRPHSAGHRFVFPQPNGAWQIDATAWVLTQGRGVWIMNLLDDHSRLSVASRAVEAATTEIAWETLSLGGERYGLPQHVISDNGSCFTGRFLSGGEVIFEQNLRQVGITHIRSTPGHPQTCGKLERWHQTLKQWLRAQPRAETVAELQTQLDRFGSYYNSQRGHRALSGATPLEVWKRGDKAHPGPPLLLSPKARLLTVDRYGRVGYDGHILYLGMEYAHWPILVIRNGLSLTIIADHRIITRITLDPARRYQPNPKPKGATRNQVGPCS